MKQKIEIEVDVPEGWEVVTWRELRPGDWYLSNVTGQALLSAAEYGERRLILRRVEPKRESRWRNLYRIDEALHLAFSYSSRANADKCAYENRVAVERIDYEDGKPVNVALESVEGER